MYVVTRCETGGVHYTDYTYYSNGLLKKEAYNGSGAGTKYTYDSNKRVKTVNNGAGAEKYSYKSGRISKSSSVNNTTKYTYNSSGQLIKKVQKSIFDSSVTIYKYKYDSKGRLASLTDSGEYYQNYKKIKYDSKGQIKSYTIERFGNIKLPFRHINTYKNGRLVKSIGQDYIDGKWWQASQNTYKYKKIQVPASMVAKVKAQQHDILSPAQVGIAIVTAQAGTMKL